MTVTKTGRQKLGNNTRHRYYGDTLTLNRNLFEYVNRTERVKIADLPDDKVRVNLVLSVPWEDFSSPVP